MRPSRPPISLGDGVRALGELRPRNDETARQILALVGIRVATPTPAAPSPRPPREVDVEEVPEQAPPEPPVTQEHDDGDVGDEPETSLGDILPSSLDRRPTGESAGIVGVPELPQGEASSELPPIEPLLLPTWLRGIASAALSVSLPDGPPDVERVVDEIARGHAITDVPRQRMPTLRLGVQLLVDRSVRMTPFAKDQEWLDEALRRVLGDERVQRHHFTGAPPADDDVDATREETRRYQPPPPGTPVLALTDLGIGQPIFDPSWVAPDDWLAFAGLLRRAGCPLVVLVPYPSSRWPRRLARELTILQWDRVTSAATIRGRVGSAATR